MKCFVGIEEKLEDNMMFYREPVQIDKDWSHMFSSVGRRSFLVVEVSVF